MAIRNEVLDELLKDYKNPEDLIGSKGLLTELTKRLVERAMEGEMTHHLGYEKNSVAGNGSGNSRNGKGGKTIQTEQGDIDIETPRDRNGTFEPQLIKKRQKRFKGFDDKIISMYARGMTTRDIQGHLKDMYGVEISPELISIVTSNVMEDVQAWQSRPLERIYPVIYLDAVRMKIREAGHIINKAVYLALGVNLEGKKEALGMWIEQTEGAKFWMMIMTELKNRGVEDIFIACVDGLKGFPEAIESIFPKTQVQLSIIHVIRNSLRYVSWKDRKAVAADLKPIYTAMNAEAAETALKSFEEKWKNKYPTIVPIWNRNWQEIIPFLAYPEDIRKTIYTTNAIESLNHSLRKVTKNRGAFPNDEAALKLLYMALRNAAKKWTLPLRNWKQALNQFAIIFEGRFPLGLE